MKVSISADSTSDLAPELCKKYDIAITPLYIVTESGSYRDGLEIRPEDIFRRVESGYQPPGTAAVSVQDYMDFFRARLEQCDAIIHFHISSDMSSCWQNACIAASELGKVYPVDTRSLCSGIALLALDACEMAEAGMDAEEIYLEVNRRKEKLNSSFLLDTLDYLRRGGRCSTVAALGANLLSLKPCIELHDGKMSVGKKYRGKLDKCLTQFIRDRLANRTDVDLRRAFLTHTPGFSLEELEQLKTEVQQCQNFQEILESGTGCTIANHCGPRTVGLFYYNV